MNGSQNLLYKVIFIILLLWHTSLVLAGDEGVTTAEQQAVAGAMAKKTSEKTPAKKTEPAIDSTQAKEVIAILEDEGKRAKLIRNLKTIVAVQDKTPPKADQSVISSTRSLLGGFAERSLVGIQTIITSFLLWADHGITSVRNYSPMDILLTLAVFLFGFIIASSIEIGLRQISKQRTIVAEEIKTMGEQVRFVMTQITFFLSFSTPLYLINAMGIGLFGYIKPFCLELAALVILGRAAVKVHGIQLLVRNRSISDISVILMVFILVIFFIFLYFMHFSYLIHLGIYLSVLYGFFLALRFSLWRADRKEIDHWLFFRLVHTPYGQDLYKFNDGLIKSFSIYVLVLMSLVFIQIISNQYQGTIDESQLFITGFLLLLTTLIILLAVYAKFGLLKLVERYANTEMTRFYQQTAMSGMDIITTLIVITLAISTTNLWFKNFTSIIFRPEYQDYFYVLSKIAFYLILSRFLWRLIDFSAMKSMTKKKKGNKIAIPSQLRLTLTPILRSVGHWLLLTFAIALILEEFGISILPIIYSISVLGLAISLGAQSLVKDVINGVLTLVEGNIAVGEVVTIGSHTGVVETLSLRGVVLRHASGALQTIPFSEVTNIINRSRDYGYASIEIPVSFGTKVEDVYQAMELAFKDMQNHPTLSNKILDKLTTSGIDRMVDGAYYVSGSIKIKPDPGGKFIRVFNEYFHKYLEIKGITPPLLSHH